MRDKRIACCVSVMMILVTFFACRPPQQMVAANGTTTGTAAPVSMQPAYGDRDEQRAAYEDVAALLNRRQRRRYAFLSEWPADRLRRLELWLESGITFEGRWNSKELQMMLDILDAFGAACGEARFVQLTDAALGLHVNTRGRHLELVKASGYKLPAAVWYNWAGQIVVNDALFDDAFINANYHWSFLLGEYAAPGPGVTFREVVIGHEFGHVLIDGLRAEAMAAGQGELSLEELYTATVPAHQCPHSYASANENLATELSVWALGVERTPEVDGFRSELLATAISDSVRPERVSAMSGE